MRFCQTCEISFLQYTNENVAQLDSKLDLEQSMTWDEMKELLNSEQRVRCSAILRS